MADRINFNMSFVDAVVAMSDGNPGAVTALSLLAKAAPAADPQSALDAWGPLLMLDTYEIYGSHIWLLYKDICGQDAVNALALIRACQLGDVDPRAVRTAIEAAKRGPQTDPRFTPEGIAAIRAEVRNKLDQFDRNQEKASA